MQDAWISVKVHPHAGKEVLVSLGPGRFEAWVKAKPIEGQANEAVAALIARTLRLPKAHLKLAKGGLGRRKVFRIIRGMHAD